MIRAILDPNVCISYLIASRPESNVAPVVQAAFAGRFHIVISPSVLVEVIASATSKPNLTMRIRRDEVVLPLQDLFFVGEVVRELEFTPAEFSRNPKDNSLFAHALIEELDYLVSGDRHILALRDAFPIKIVTAAELMRILDEVDENAV
jgi:putative PIN family toxin of toxin-antitoxin system